VLLREVEYAKPSSVAQALAILSENDGARALAGGQTMINVMKARAASPDALVDLAGLDDLKGIELAGDGTLSIGPMTTYTELVESAEAKARPILGEVCAQIADVQVRNRGTIGGNLCSNDPTNHLPPLMVSIGATFTIAGQSGERAVSADEFFLGVYLTAVGQRLPAHRARLRRRDPCAAPACVGGRRRGARGGAQRRPAPAVGRARVERVPVASCGSPRRARCAAGVREELDARRSAGGVVREGHHRHDQRHGV
jgi:hypothetical protein